MSPEQFLQVADHFAEPALLLTADGGILAANRTAAALGSPPRVLTGRALADLTATPADAVHDYLGLCSRSREPVVGSLTLRDESGREVPCRCHGAVVHHDADGRETRLLLRLTPAEATANSSAVLNQKLDELTEAVERHQGMEEHLTALVEASAALTGTLEPPSVLTSILQLSEKLLPADAYAVWRFHPSTGQWSIAASSGLSEKYQEETVRVLGQSPGMPDTPVVAEDVEALPLLAERKEAYRAEGIRSLLVVPLHVNGHVRGTLVIYCRRPHRFTDMEVRLGTAVANLSAAAINSAELYAEQARLGAEAQTREDWLRVTLASIGDAVIATDTGGRVTFLNPVAESLTGWSSAEAQGRQLEEVFRIANEQTRQAVENPVHRVLREGVVVGLANHTVLNSRDGRVIPLDDSAAPIRNPEGQVAGVVLIFRDVTERKRSEQDARFLADASAALAALVDYGSTLQKVARLAVPTFADWCAVDMLDEAGTLRRLAVAHVDPSKVELAHELHRRYPPDPASPRGVWHILSTGRSEMVAEITDDFLAATVPDAELLRIIRALGLRSYMGVPLTVRGQVLGVVTFIAAESGRRYDAADLAVAEDLAHRAAVAIENARLYQAVREADRRKDEFLALLGHELRNPLAPIRNALHILKMPEARGAIADRAREMMERQVEHLVRLVDDLLDVSRIMRGKVELRREPVELASVVARAVETSQPVIDAESHRLTVSVPPEPLWLDGDQVRLAQVVSNLLNNAAKYTERGGSISLSTAREDDEAVLRVRDTGIGIAPALLPRLFDMFFQAERRTKESHGGLGIGLSLVRGIVELHGGSVEAHSAGAGTGSEFVVRLPLLVRDKQEGGQQATETRPAPVLPPRRVLVVDDNVDAADSLAMLLRLQGQKVEVAYEGAAALSRAATDPPVIAFIDLGMPKMDGYEVARAFRVRPALEDTVLVALTGWGQPEDRQRTLEAGFDHHLVKPVEAEALHQLLAGLGAAGKGHHPPAESSS